MKVNPVVRYMILCDDWGYDPINLRRINAFGILSSITSEEDPPYPLRVPELCVVLILTGGRGTGNAQLVCTFEDTGQRIFASRNHTVSFPTDPLEVVGTPFRVIDCPFPSPGLYSIQFWYNNVMIEERPLLLR